MVNPNRRDFLKATAATSLAAIAGAGLSASIARGQNSKGLKILILGGTRFIGPWMVRAAKARGHSITLFNRGQTEAIRGDDFPDVEKLYGNRDPEKLADETKKPDGSLVNPDSPKGLASLKDRSWDIVIDTSGYYPRHVKASAELLAPKCGHYIFISSVSAYAKNDTPDADESAALGTLTDPTVETMGPNAEYYGPLKVLCEQAVEKAFPGKCSIVRPGYIVGPGDGTDRFSYWPLRIKRGGEVLAPGEPTDPLQIIDARDLAEWCIALGENRTSGAFNAVGPAKPHAWGDVLETCKKIAGSDAKLTWVNAKFLEEHAEPQDGFPIWITPTGEYAGFHKRSTVKSVKAGLKFRPLAETVKDILAWYPKELERRAEATKRIEQRAEKAGQEKPKLPDPGQIRAGILPEREQALLKLWHEQPKQ